MGLCTTNDHELYFVNVCQAQVKLVGPQEKKKKKRGHQDTDGYDPLGFSAC